MAHNPSLTLTLTLTLTPTLIGGHAADLGPLTRQMDYRSGAPPTTNDHPRLYHRKSSTDPPSAVGTVSMQSTGAHAVHAHHPYTLRGSYTICTCGRCAQSIGIHVAGARQARHRQPILQWRHAQVLPNEGALFVCMRVCVYVRMYVAQLPRCDALAGCGYYSGRCVCCISTVNVSQSAPPFNLVSPAHICG